MLTLHSISLAALFAVLVYVICFVCRYRIIPQSLSVTAEFNGRYKWWQIMICTVMGWLGYWIPTVYTFAECGYYTILASAGVAGLALAGYNSYSPDIETKHDLTVHKVGSFSGAVLVCLFYVLFLKWWAVLGVLAACLVLGVLVPGYRFNDITKRYDKSNSIVFWEEIGIVCVVGFDIVKHFIETL